MRLQLAPSGVMRRLHAHPQIVPLTKSTFCVKGGWANAFVFLPRPREARGILIDPGVSQDVERSFVDAARLKAGAILFQDGRTEPGIREALQNQESRLPLLREIAGLWKAAGGLPASPIEVFLQRSEELAQLITTIGFGCDAILATHHHIDHLGVGARLRESLGLSERVFLPDPEIFERPDRRRGDYSIAHTVGGYQRLAADSAVVTEMGIALVDGGGHTKMTTLLLPDGTLVVGDLVAPANMWRSSVMYMEDAAEHVRSLERILALPYGRLALSHGTRYLLDKEEGDRLIRLNIQQVRLAIGAAQKNEDPAGAADAYLQQTRGAEGEVPFRYLFWSLVTSQYIEAYRPNV